MRNWIELGSDVNWIDYHGMWARQAPDGSWYVLRWTNLLDAGGEEFADTPYECEVKRIDLDDTPAEQIKSALECCGLRATDEGIISGGDIVAAGDKIPLCLVECLIQYGGGAPLETFTGKRYPTRIRAEARRYAEECMRNMPLLAKQLARPVNRIGSTAEEYGKGDIDAALARGPFDTAKNIMRKLHDLPPGESK
jgi:hypothetical protein